jgi:hypothetical protein
VRRLVLQGETHEGVCDVRHGTPVINSWALYANGEELLNGGAVNCYEARIFLTNGTILTQDGSISRAHWASVPREEPFRLYQGIPFKALPGYMVMPQAPSIIRFKPRADVFVRDRAK